ncbi:ATP synthase F0 subunit B [Fimbriiglobus ruber]|uniref:ATP synthase subunit b n=1 Tax=Fimbriiglobus ruber TaxID=1908690 RepID=A0A225E0M6_9BACT|nr:ATP synthase F0 subunit B [Fimbriiglobus ruber]OWK47151.1 ATP synthase F0 sector subunit b [Fimbriiglobus ruber]
MRTRLTARPAGLFAIAVFAALAATSPALAASHGEEPSGGLSFLALHRYDLGIFTLITFGLLCAILYWKAWPKISEGLKKREEVITQARDEAIKTRHEAEEIRAKLKAEFGQAHDQIRALMEEARKDAERLRAEEKIKGEAEAAAERERAKREIAAAKEQALQEIYQKSVQLASLMSSKAIRRNMSADDHARLVDESLAELKTRVSRN